MDVQERITYIQQFFAFEFEEYGQTWLVDEIDWSFHMLLAGEVDTNNVTKPYGILPPHYIDGIWVLGVCPARMARYIETDDELADWLSYWLAYAEAYLHLLAEAEMALTFGELQERVEATLTYEIPDIEDAAETFKQRQPQQ